MSRQLFIECNLFSPIHLYICGFDDINNAKLNQYESLIVNKFNIEYTFYKYHIPVIFPISIVKNIISKKFLINEEFLLYSNEFNIEIEFTNSDNIYNPIKLNKNERKIITRNEHSLFIELNYRKLEINNITMNFIRASNLNNRNILQYFIPISNKYTITECEKIIIPFINNKEFNYKIENNELLIIYKSYTQGDLFNINNVLQEEGWDCSGIYRSKNNIILYTNNISDIDILRYTKNDSFIIFSKKKIYCNKISEIYLISKILNINNEYMSKKKTKIIFNNFNMKKNNSLLIDIFLENDQIVPNIKRTYNKELKIFFNKNNFMFISSGCRDEILLYISKILYSFNMNNINIKRSDKIDQFFISRTCQNLEKKKRNPITINYDDTFIKKDSNYFIAPNQIDIFYNNGLYYKCDENNVYKYIGFLNKFDDKCIPCCYLKPQYKSNIFNKCISQTNKTEVKLYNLFILLPNRLISHNKQLKFLPTYLNNIFNENNKIKYDPQTNLLLKTTKYILLTYYDNTEIIDNNTIIITDYNIIFNINNYKTSNIIYKQNDIYYEKLIMIEKPSESSDYIEVSDIDNNIIIDLIEKKLNNNIIYKKDNTTITNRGIYYKNKQVFPNTKFTVSKSTIDLEYGYKNNKIDLTELFNNIIVDNNDIWLFYKFFNIDTLNNISKDTNVEKYSFF